MALEYPSKKRDVVELAILNSGDSVGHHALENPDEISDIAGEKKMEEVIEYPGPMKLFFITLALCLAVFLVALDQTIIATVSEWIKPLSSLILTISGSTKDNRSVPHH
jgi:hypothetical protein